MQRLIGHLPILILQTILVIIVVLREKFCHTFPALTAADQPPYAIILILVICQQIAASIFHHTTGNIPKCVIAIGFYIL